MLADLHEAISKICPILGVSKLLDGTYSISFLGNATEQQRQAAQALADLWVDGPEPRLVFSLDFLDRFSEQTQLKIVTEAMKIPSIRLWYDRLLAAQQVDLNSPRLRAGLEAMRQAGLLTTEEIAQALD
jgi:hypothetical protein